MQHSPKKKMIFQTDWVSDWTGKKKSVTNWGKNEQKNLKITDKKITLK